MLVSPLLVSALIVGVAEMGEMRALKTVGLRTLVYTVVVSSIAVAISLAMVNALQPGAGVDPALAKTLLAGGAARAGSIIQRSEEHTSELQSLMRISYAVFCLTQNNTTRPIQNFI